MILGPSLWYLKTLSINTGTLLLDLSCSNKGLPVSRSIKMTSIEAISLILPTFYVEVMQCSDFLISFEIIYKEFCKSVQKNLLSEVNTKISSQSQYLFQKSYVSLVSACFIRSTTGTEVHGISPNSVITKEMNSGGVTS